MWLTPEPSPGLVLQDEESRVELRDLTEAIPILDYDPVSVPRQQPVTAQLLERAVHMHRREPQHIAQLGLGEGKTEAVAICLPDRLQAHEQLADKMSHLAKCLLPAGRKPLPMHGTVQGRVQPQQAREMRVALCDLADGFMRHMRDRARGERHDAVVHPLEHEAVQIDEVPRDMDGADPTLAVAQDLVAPCKALQEELTLARTIPLAHHVLALLDG